MPDLLVRDLSEETVELLKARAKRAGKSLQAELREFLEHIAMAESRTGEALAAEIRAKLADWKGGSAERPAEDASR